MDPTNRELRIKGSFQQLFLSHRQKQQATLPTTATTTTVTSNFTMIRALVRNAGNVVHDVSLFMTNQSQNLFAPLSSYSARILQQFDYVFHDPSQRLSIAVDGAIDLGDTSSTKEQNNIWFAVPKSRVTRSKKRMKTTNQKRIKLRKDIVWDKRTGELTLRHRLPFNWKDHLPKFD